MDDLVKRSDVINVIHERNEELLQHKEYRNKRGDIDLLGLIPKINCIRPVEAEPSCSICKSSATGFDFKPLKRTEERKNCPMRHENGNCLAIGGFCLAVNDEICQGLHNAYNKKLQQ